MSIIVLAEQNENMKRFYAIAFTSLLRQRRQLIAFAMALHTHILILHHPTNKGALNLKPRIVYAKWNENAAESCSKIREKSKEWCRKKKLSGGYRNDRQFLNEPFLCTSDERQSATRCRSRTQHTTSPAVVWHCTSDSYVWIVLLVMQRRPILVSFAGLNAFSILARFISIFYLRASDFFATSRLLLIYLNALNSLSSQFFMRHHSLLCCCSAKISSSFRNIVTEAKQS